MSDSIYLNMDNEKLTFFSHRTKWVGPKHEIKTDYINLDICYYKNNSLIATRTTGRGGLRLLSRGMNYLIHKMKLHPNNDYVIGFKDKEENFSVISKYDCKNKLWNPSIHFMSNDSDSLEYWIPLLLYKFELIHHKLDSIYRIIDR